jgi:hypothetical protein
VRRMRCWKRVGSSGSRRWWWLGARCKLVEKKAQESSSRVSDECSYPAQLSLPPGADWPINAMLFACWGVMLYYVHCICTIGFYKINGCMCSGLQDHHRLLLCRSPGHEMSPKDFIGHLLWLPSLQLCWASVADISAHDVSP